MNQIAQDFSSASERYDAYATMQQIVLEESALQLAAYLQPSDVVLDIGCGTGALAKHLEQPLIGCDIAESMCRVTPFANACARAEMLPFADESVGAVFSNLALQWVEGKAAALAEAQRVCKPNGVALFTSLGPQTLLALDRYGIPRLAFEEVNYYQQSALAAGWEIERVDSEIKRFAYDHLIELLREIKAIGARHKTQRGRLTRAVLAEPFIAEWEVITLVLRKPAE